MTRWLETAPTADGGTMLVGDGTEHVAVFLREQADGGWGLVWSVGLEPDVTLPQAEDFIARVARFIEDEPVEP